VCRRRERPGRKVQAGRGRTVGGTQCEKEGRPSGTSGSRTALAPAARSAFLLPPTPPSPPTIWPSRSLCPHKGPKIPWRAGRVDAPDANAVTPDGRLPDADKGSPGKTAQGLRNTFYRMGWAAACPSGVQGLGFVYFPACNGDGGVAQRGNGGQGLGRGRTLTWRGEAYPTSTPPCPTLPSFPHQTQPTNQPPPPHTPPSFDDREIVALSGAHGLGRCHAEASGYVGPWTGTPELWSGNT
jgi:hypothetical protein